MDIIEYLKEEIVIEEVEESWCMEDMPDYAEMNYHTGRIMAYSKVINLLER